MPSVVMTATADQLVKVINDRCNEIHSLSTTVDFQLTGVVRVRERSRPTPRSAGTFFSGSQDR
jgi:hypothetical protein